MTEPNRVCPAPSPRSFCPELDAEAAAADAVCTKDAARPSAPPAGNAELRSLSPGAERLIAQFGARPETESNNNAGRTAARSSAESYADYGITSSADAAYGGLAALKTRDPETGVDAEVLSASLQIGGEMEAQAGLARLGISGKTGSAGVEVFTARANGGAHNDDGSTGFNAGAMATAIGAEGTLFLGAETVTVGASLSLGAAVSIGVRDVNADGAGELCAKVSAGPITVGVCVEVAP